MKDNNDNTMAPHFRKAVAEMDEDIQKLRDDITRLAHARGTLLELYGGETELPPVASLPDRSGTEPRPGVQTRGRKRKARTPRAAIAGRAPTGAMVRVMSFARTCPEPFTVSSLAVGTGEDKKFLSNRITVWFKQGLIERVGCGEYKRTASFPAEAPAE